MTGIFQTTFPYTFAWMEVYELQYELQHALHNVEEFSKFCGLVLKKNKTEALMIGKKKPDSTNGIKWISKGAT